MSEITFTNEQPKNSLKIISFNQHSWSHECTMLNLDGKWGAELTVNLFKDGAFSKETANLSRHGFIEFCHSLVGKILSCEYLVAYRYIAIGIDEERVDE